MGHLTAPALAVAATLLAATPALAAGALETRAEGVQIYACTGTGSSFAWTLKAPEATLTSVDGKTVIHHFAGPSWQAPDGSAVVGEVAAAGGAPPAGPPGSIPWLVLRAASHSGTGLLDKVAFVIRSDTAGGAAPATGCDAAHANAETHVPYTAIYTFFGVT